MPSNSKLFPGLASRLGVQRQYDPADDLERAERRDLAEQARRDLDRSRATDLSDFGQRDAARQRARRGSGRSRKDDPRVWTDAIIESVGGRSLAQIIGAWAQGLPKLIGASGVNSAAFTSFQQALWQAVNDLGLVVQPPRLPPNSANRSDVRRELAARALGITNAKVAPSRAEVCRRFDELAAHFSEATTLSGVMADGSSDGIPAGAAEVIGAQIVTIRNNLLAGNTVGAARAGEDAGALLALLWEVTNGGATAQRGYVRRVKSTRPRGKVVGIEVGGEVVAVKDVDLSGGMPRRLRNFRDPVVD